MEIMTRLIESTTKKNCHQPELFDKTLLSLLTIASINHKIKMLGFCVSKNNNCATAIASKLCLWQLLSVIIVYCYALSKENEFKSKESNFYCNLIFG